jgi:hypothetical protein
MQAKGGRKGNELRKDGRLERQGQKWSCLFTTAM